MKKILIGLVALMSVSAFAQTSINITTRKHSYSMYTEMIQGIAQLHQENLSDVLGEGLECRLVKVKTNIFKEPGLFSDGSYSLTLTAECNKTATDVALKVGYGQDYGNPWSMTVTYTAADGQKYQAYSQDSSPD